MPPVFPISWPDSCGVSAGFTDPTVCDVATNSPLPKNPQGAELPSTAGMCGNVSGVCVAGELVTAPLASKPSATEALQVS